MESPYRILLQKERIKKILADCPNAPSTIDVELSWSCNENCGWCYCKEMHKNGFLSMQNISDILMYCKDYGVEWIILSGGGEPTLHPNFLEILGCLNDADVNYMLITNGYALTENAIEYLAQGCKYVRISLDSACKETYARLHNTAPEAFDAVVNNIRLLRRSSSEITICLSYIVVKDNYIEIPDFISLAEELGANGILLKQDINLKTSKLYERALLEYSHEIEVSTVPITCRNAARDNFETAKHCYSAFLKMIITPDGDVPACCSKRDQRFVIGNINDARIQDIWESEHHRRMIQSIHPSSCPNCRVQECNSIIERFFSKHVIFDFI